MQIARFSTRAPHLIQALQALAARTDHVDVAQGLLADLSGITVLVAKRFTNDRTAEGIQEALNLTVGCISLGISQTETLDNKESMLNFLLQHGAEYVFQMGFRHIKLLATLPQLTSVCEIDFDPTEMQRNLKRHLIKFCRANPHEAWTGDSDYQRALPERKKNQAIIDCAKWLRKEHYLGPVKDHDLYAHEVITIAAIFAIAGDAPIVARLKLKDAETLIQGMRQYSMNIDDGWASWLKKIPPQHQLVLREQMDQLRNNIIKKITSDTHIKKVISEIQSKYAVMEQDIDFD